MRVGLRSLLRAKGLAATVVITLALGIGANAAIFSVVRGVLLRPLVNRGETGFAGIALLIAIVGVAGVLAFGVSARTREFGVRLAIGSTPRELLQLFRECPHAGGGAGGGRGRHVGCGRGGGVTHARRAGVTSRCVACIEDRVTLDDARLFLQHHNFLDSIAGVVGNFVDHALAVEGSLRRRANGFP